MISLIIILQIIYSISHLKPWRFPCLFLRGSSLPFNASAALSESFLRLCLESFLPRTSVDSSMMIWTLSYFKNSSSILAAYQYFFNSVILSQGSFSAHFLIIKQVFSILFILSYCNMYWIFRFLKVKQGNISFKSTIQPHHKH